MKSAEAIVDKQSPAGPLPFTPAARVGNLIFVSGQASVDRAGKIVKDTFEGEMRRSIENLKHVLSLAGVGLEHVVQTRNYVGRQEDLADFNRIYKEYFSAPYPVRTTIMNCLGDVIKYEIEAIATTA